MTDPVRLVEVTRRDEVAGRDLVESIHVGHVVVTVDGELVSALGNPLRPTFSRSSVKPVQAAVCLEILAEHDWPGGRPSSREIAIGWASHRAADEHLSATRELCERAGITPEELTCPPDLRPGDTSSGRHRIHHNCSGKHALFALAGHALGLHGDELLDRAGPLQERLLDAVDDVFGPLDAVGVDGCGAPAVRSPLVRLAGGFARLAAEDRFQDVRDAAFAHPLLIAGEGWLDSSLLAAGTLAKRGAEGVRAAGWTANGKRVGVALKMEDGADRGADVALAAVIEAAGRPVGGWEPEVMTGGGNRVGEVRPSALLLEVLRAVGIPG